MSCITLLSDFGLQDASVAVAKGILMQHNAGLAIIDISHEAKPFYTAEAVYLLASTWRHFPAGTCHLALFDLFSEKTVKVLVAELDGHYFITADNGLLPAALNNLPETRIYKELSPEETFTDWLHAAGRAVADLQNSGLPEMGLTPFTLKNTAVSHPLESGDKLFCDVMHTDRYENVVLNVTKSKFENIRAGRPFRLEFAQVEEITEVSGNYADVRPGLKLCRFNSSGYMEICVNRGNAASLFGLRPGGKKNEIKITFG